MRDQVPATIDTELPRNDIKHNKIDVARALKLRLKNGLSFDEIALHFSCSRQAVHQALRRFLHVLDHPEAIKAFEDSKAALLTVVEMKLLESLVDKDKLSKASLNNVAYAYDQIHKANRLEQDLSTSNIAEKLIFTVIHQSDDSEDQAQPNESTPAGEPAREGNDTPPDMVGGEDNNEEEEATP